MIVLATNVVSELMRPSPAPAVVAWLRRQARGSLTTTAVTIAEITFGLARLPAGRRTAQLQLAAADVLASFPGQVLPFDGAAAARYGEIAATRERAGHPIDALDAQIAAICQIRRAPLATRNTKDFVSTGIDVLDPWEA
jgi:toxin FitB